MAERTEEDHAGVTACAACAIARGEGDAPWLAESELAVADDAVVVSGPRIDGRIVIPRHHVGGLDELALPQQAQVLAAVRRAAATVGAAPPGPPAEVATTTGPPGSESHVCFLVRPGAAPVPDA